MNRRFVIAVDGLDRDEQRQLREFLREHGAWWHWIENFWLLSTTSGEEISAAMIRDRIESIKPDTRALVFEFPEDIDWAARGKPNAEGKNITDWLKGAWARK